MKTFLRWHENFTEKKRKFYKLSHYQAYWVSWIKGLLTGAIILYLILIGWSEEILSKPVGFY